MPEPTRFLDQTGLNQVWGKAKNKFVNSDQPLTDADIEEACASSVVDSETGQVAQLSDYVRKDSLGTETILTDAEFDTIFT